jgi:ureidoglycolate dehydrogenase (NAD+)
MPSKNESHVIPSADLERFASALFAAAGVAPAMADEWAKSLVWANLRGVDSHGVLRIPGYIERLKTGAINPTPKMRVEKRAVAVAVLEAARWRWRRRWRKRSLARSQNLLTSPRCGWT